MSKAFQSNSKGCFRCFNIIVPICFILLVVGAQTVWAGPPFVTDDPEPAEYQHGEIYVSSVTARNSSGTSGTLPHLEFNYGLLPDVHVHLIVPFAYNKPSGESMKWGYGDTELGVKFRFVHETDTIPQIGTFPIVVLPSGDSSKGLGESGTRVLIPIWLQKSFGPWTVYGGGGYWYNPGQDKKNYWQTGVAVMREISKTVSVGAELFDFTARVKGEKSETGFNIGSVINVTDDHHILFSAGRDFRGTDKNKYTMYIGYQFTFGPHEKK